MEDLLNQASYCLDRTFSSILHGGARGVDRMAGRWAHSKDYPVDVYFAQWETHGKSAGYIRNQKMVSDCGAAIVIWDGVSKGTRHTINLLIESGKDFALVRRNP